MMSTTSTGSALEVPAPTFELETWSSNYEGALLPLRLTLVAIRCPSLRRQSLSLAVAAVKRGKDVQLYERVCELARDLRLPEASGVDSEWVARTEEANRRELSRLEGELRGYKNNLIRESIRMGQEDLAAHHLATGGPRPDAQQTSTSNNVGYNAAFQAFNKMREFCHTPSQMNAMNLRLVYTALVQAVTAQQAGYAAAGNYNNVNQQAARLRTTGCKEEEQKPLTAISHVTSGIAYLGTANYADAAAAFLRAPFESYHHIGVVHGFDFERLVASTNDVAIYGALTALATLSRDELQEQVLGGDFRPFLEQEPHMRKAITLYVTAKYEQCIALLQRYRADWSLDIFLSAHVDSLLARIRQRSITAYFSSYSQVSIAALAATFPPLLVLPSDGGSAADGITGESVAVQAMENELLGMIQRGQLDARLDVVDGMLLAPQKDLRRETHHAARESAAEIERTLLLRLHRVNMMLGGLEIRKEARGKHVLGSGAEAGEVLMGGAY